MQVASLRELCGVLKKTRDSYYKYLSREGFYSSRSKAILEKVSNIREDQPCCGTRKLHLQLKDELQQEGIFVGRDRLFEILREEGLLIKKRKRKFPITTYSNHTYAVASNVLKTIEVIEPGQAVCADITYVRTGESFAYLFLITDIYSRTILGHHLSDSLNHDGAIVALKQACRNLPHTVEVIHHSDRGIQYCCHAFKEELSKRGMISSMTDDNHCAQNAIAERINGILKGEFFIDAEFIDFGQAKAAIRNAIEIYNHKRPHMSLGYSTPYDVYFAKLLEKRLAA